jgi:hypothetical protein
LTLHDATSTRPAPATVSRRLLVGLYVSCLLTSAFLLFIVQPMFAKLVLPFLGGSAAVWTTCMLFFQAALLAGYAYAHFSMRLLGPRRQIPLHAVIVLVPLAVLPIDLASVAPRGGGAPIPWLLALLATTIGLPFFALSMTAPLLQRWFSFTDHPAARDPYFLYAASNAGSLGALLLYPALFEPTLSLRTQRLFWSAGYVVAAALVICAAFAVWRGRPDEHVGPSASRTDAPPMLRQARWVFLSAIPSGLMLAVTAHISTDIAAVPLLWIVPLALYLVTFILAFGAQAERVLRLARRVLPLVLLPVVLLLAARGGAALWFSVPLHLIAFLVVALVCHCELAADRPPAEDLTAFYLWLSFGGMLGGLFNTLVAPVLFSDIVEYPLLLAAAVFAIVPVRSFGSALRERAPLVRAVLAGGLAILIVSAAPRLGLDTRWTFLLLTVPIVFAFSVSRQPALFAVAVALVLLSAGVSGTAWGDVQYARRTFYGIHRVSLDRDGEFVALYHGTTLHGSQAVGAADPEPLTYYHRGSPIADVFDSRKDGERGSIGVIGLGVGTLAAYADAGERWTFYELDPAVEAIARDERYFTFLRACGTRCRVVIGDGRLTLSADPARHDVLVIDAFSSDAIPVHLMTREGVRMYLSRLTETGVVAFHISNRHFDLRAPLARLARDERLAAQVRFERVDEQDPPGTTSSLWAILARSREHFGSLADDPRWTPLAPDGKAAWTDDFSNVWSALQWRGTRY